MSRAAGHHEAMTDRRDTMHTTTESGPFQMQYLAAVLAAGDHIHESLDPAAVALSLQGMKGQKGFDDAVAYCFERTSQILYADAALKGRPDVSLTPDQVLALQRYLAWDRTLNLVDETLSKRFEVQALPMDHDLTQLLNLHAQATYFGLSWTIAGHTYRGVWVRRELDVTTGQHFVQLELVAPSGVPTIGFDIRARNWEDAVASAWLETSRTFDLVKAGADGIGLRNKFLASVAPLESLIALLYQLAAPDQVAARVALAGHASANDLGIRTIHVQGAR